MDDNKINSEENQPKTIFKNAPRPVFETVPENESATISPQAQLKPEEISPDMQPPQSHSSPVPADVLHNQPAYHEGNKAQYIFAGVGIIFFLFIFFILFRLFFGQKAVQKETKLLYWGLWEDQEVFDPLVKEYQGLHKNITITYQKMSPQDYREKLLARSKNGEGPDIFRFHNTWIPQIKEVMTAVPPNIMSKSEFEKVFYPIHQSDLNIGGKYYGLPLMIDGLVLVYNEGLLRKAGINTAPSSWEDVFDFAGRLSVKDKDGTLITGGIALGTASNVEHFSDIFGLILIQNGGDIRRMNQPEAVGALEGYRRFSEPPNNVWDKNMPNSTVAFIQEKVGMIIVPSWEILNIKAANPDIVLKVAPIPLVPGGKAVSIASYWIEGVSRFSKNQIESWNFLKFLVQKENVTKLYSQQVKTRLFGEPYSRVDLAQTLIQDPYIGAVIKQADSYVSLPMISKTYDNGLNDEINRYIENAINATMEGVSYEEALQTVQNGIDQIFTERYKIE